MKKLTLTHFIAGCNISLCMLLAGSVFQPLSAQTYTFTTCGATGQFGPNQGQVNATYVGGNALTGLVTVLGQGTQQWTAPGAGLYKIEAVGAKGGNTQYGSGGLGARMIGDFNLTAGQVLKIVVGQMGSASGDNQGSGGGGGSFVADNANNILIIAGGGGGNGSTFFSAVDVDATTGVAKPGNSCGGCAGTPGQGGTLCGSMAGSCGGGFFSDGANNGASRVNCNGGRAFVNGSAGGTNEGTGSAGFGGGGGGSNNCGYGGGGGGYSGGGGGGYGCNCGGNGGGGGSINNGVNQTNQAAYNAGDGKVIITRLCNISLVATSNPICIGQSLTLSTDAVSGITWSGSGSTANSIVVTPNATTSYTVVGTSTANCQTSSIITITVNPLPVLAAIVTPTTLCVGKTATITASGAATYTWNGGPTGSSLMVNPGVNTTYNLTGASQFGCLSSGTVAVNVNTNNISVPSAVTVCKGNPIDLIATGAITYTWSSGSNFSTAHVTPVSNITYTVSGIDNFGCNLSNMVAVTVNSSPTVVASSNKSNICKNESVSLSAQGANTYTWSNGSIGTPVNLNLGVDVVYTYTVTGEDNNGCMGTSVITVNVNKCTGINEFGTSGLNVQVYPNPASSDVTIELNNGSEKSLKVIDLSGREVLSALFKEDKTTLNLSTLAAGIYYIKVQSGNATGVVKIVKTN